MSFKDKLKEVLISGTGVLPLVEGGKGIAASDGYSAGAWAACGGVGTFSAVNPRIPGRDDLGLLESYSSKIRFNRQKEMIERAITGGIEQARIAYETARKCGRIHMNVLWEMGGVEEVLHGILSKVKGLVHGVTCGAGMPFKIAEICAKYEIKYYPIVSSARAFSILWRRAYSKFVNLLGGVVYEDPWLAGGHNGLSTDENEDIPEKPEPRVRKLRDYMRSVGISDLVPIFMAGGVWWLSEWFDWIENKDLGAIAFQFGTRPLLTVESPIPETWKKKLLTLKPGDVCLNRFSPTGFPSSAVKNSFLFDLYERDKRQVSFSEVPSEEFTVKFNISAKTEVWLKSTDQKNIKNWIDSGWKEAVKTPNKTLVFISKEEKKEMISDRQNCIGCLSACKFSGWQQDTESKVTITPDPRSFCIQKSLQRIVGGETENALMFCGHQGYRFAEDEFYAGGKIPTVSSLIDRILTGF